MTKQLIKEIYIPLVKGSSFEAIRLDRYIYKHFAEGGTYNEIYYKKVTTEGGPKFERIKVNYAGEDYKAVFKANKYLKKQYRRLYKALIEEKDIGKYTMIFNVMKNKSKSFLIANWVRVHKYYHRNYSSYHVLKHLKKIYKLLNKNATELKYKRVFLAEYNMDGTFKKYRPLGVPSIHWRVIMSMYYLYLVNIIGLKWNYAQFGGLPKRGVGDAWIAILKRINKYKTLIGIDLAKFFDTVNLHDVYFKLKMEYDCEHETFILLKKIFSSHAKIKEKERKLEEERLKKLREEVPTIVHVDTLGNIRVNFFANEENESLPQGLNTSPLMAMMSLMEALDWIKDQHVYPIHYVDDAVLFSNKNTKETLYTYIDSLNTAATGIGISRDKTEIIKEEGKWLKPLKFLGCSYGPNSEGEMEFRAHTRGGKTIILQGGAERISEIINWLEEHKWELSQYEKRKEMNKILMETWNPTGEYPKKISELMWKDFKRSKHHFEWRKDCILEQVFKRYKVSDKLKVYISPINTQTMLCAGYLLNRWSKKVIRDQKNTR